jgi:hypothetical protein
MALINRESVIPKIMTTLARMSPPQGVEILSYKRNRGVDVLLCPGETIRVREHGYGEEEFEVAADSLERLLKTLIKKEFPRSRKLRVSQISGPEELNRPKKKL